MGILCTHTHTIPDSDGLIVCDLTDEKIKSFQVYSFLFSYLVNQFGQRTGKHCTKRKEKAEIDLQIRIDSKIAWKTVSLIDCRFDNYFMQIFQCRSRSRAVEEFFKIQISFDTDRTLT